MRKLKNFTYLQLLGHLQREKEREMDKKGKTFL